MVSYFVSELKFIVYHEIFALIEPRTGDDRIGERIFDGSIIESASSVRARDWRSYTSKSDSRYDTTSRNSSSSHQQNSSECTRKTGMLLALTEGRGNAKGEIGELCYFQWLGMYGQPAIGYF